MASSLLALDILYGLLIRLFFTMKADAICYHQVYSIYDNKHGLWNLLLLWSVNDGVIRMGLVSSARDEGPTT